MKTKLKCHEYNIFKVMSSNKENWVITVNSWFRRNNEKPFYKNSSSNQLMRVTNNFTNEDDRSFIIENPNILLSQMKMKQRKI